MNLDIAWSRLSKRFVKRDIHRTVGRFGTVRKTYTWLQKERQKNNAAHHRDRLNLREKSLFPATSPVACAEEMRNRSVSLGFQLPSEMVAEIRSYACETPLYEPGYDGLFNIDDVVKGRLPDGHIVMRGLVQEPSACHAIEQVA